MKSKGFSRKRYVFNRLVNNKIVQKLSYFMFNGQREFTIQFCFEPLCCGEEIEVFMDEQRLEELTGDKSLEFNPEDPNALRETLKLCRQFLFPLFDSVIDYDSYLGYMKERNQKKIASYNEKTRKRVEPLYTDGLFTQNSAVYYISLVKGNYDLAQKSRESLIKYRISVHLNNWGTKTHINPEVQKEFENMRDNYNSIKNAMDTNNRIFIEAYVHANEKHALESYIRNFYGKRAFDAYQHSGKLPSDLTK